MGLDKLAPPVRVFLLHSIFKANYTHEEVAAYAAAVTLRLLEQDRPDPTEGIDLS